MLQLPAPSHLRARQPGCMEIVFPVKENVQAAVPLERIREQDGHFHAGRRTIELIQMSGCFPLCLSQLFWNYSCVASGQHERLLPFELLLLLLRLPVPSPFASSWRIEWIDRFRSYCCCMKKPGEGTYGRYGCCLDLRLLLLLLLRKDLSRILLRSGGLRQCRCGPPDYSSSS